MAVSPQARRGRSLGRIASGPYPAGSHALTLPAGADLSSGIYFARVRLLGDGRADVRTARLALVPSSRED